MQAYSDRLEHSVESIFVPYDGQRTTASCQLIMPCRVVQGSSKSIDLSRDRPNRNWNIMLEIGIWIKSLSFEKTAFRGLIKCPLVETLASVTYIAFIFRSTRAQFFDRSRQPGTWALPGVQMQFSMPANPSAQIPSPPC